MNKRVTTKFLNHLQDFDDLNRPLYLIKIDVESLRFDSYMAKEELKTLLCRESDKDTVQNIIENIETVNDRIEYIKLCDVKRELLEQVIIERLINGEID